MTRGVKLDNKRLMLLLAEKNIKYIPLEDCNGYTKKIKWLCYKSNHVFEATPSSILSGSGCPYCSGHKVLKGFNDLWTTHPHIAKMLRYPDVGYEKSHGSTYKTDWICPDCGHIIKNKAIHDVVFRRLYCDNCGSNISYPERVLSSFLNQLHVDFIRDKTTSWSNRKRYDFIVSDLSLIIECHGGQHYLDKECWTKNNLSEIKETDERKKNLAISNGILYYVQLDCRNSSFEYIQKSICNSELSDIFDLTDFDWNLCKENICNLNYNYYQDILGLVKQGMSTPKEIADTLHIKRDTASRYLTKMSDVGIIQYDSQLAMKNNYQHLKKILSKKVICVETGIIYDSVTDAAIAYGTSPSAISACCHGRTHTSMGLHWEFYYDEVVV